MKLKTLFLSLSLLLFWGCANMLAPTGGPKDETPPNVLKTEPVNNQTSYTKKHIKITFDEYVSIDNFTSELLVSPPLKHKPEYKLSGKTLTVTWSDTLLENTTYTFLFGSSIKDVNEGNVLENYTLTFSTGQEIDSATFSGKISTAEKAEPLKSAFVFLTTEPFDDSTFFPVKAHYQTKTNSEGIFSFQGLKPASYNLYFLEDKNTNKAADNEEYVGFSDTPVWVEYPLQKEVSDSEDSLSEPQKVLPQEQKTYTAFPYYQKQRRYFKSVNAVSAQHIALIWQENVFLSDPVVLAGNDTLFSYQSNDTLFVLTPESKEITIKVQNQQGNLLYESDTIKMLSKLSSLKLFTEKKEAGETFDSVFVIRSNLPIQALDTARFLIKTDTLEFKPKVTWNTHAIFVKHTWEAGNSYQIVLSDSAVSYNDTFLNKRTQPFSYSVPKKKDLSSYELNFLRNSPQFKNVPLIVKIETGQEVYYYYMPLDKSTLVLSNLTSGTYSLTVYADTNANGMWDTGDIEQFMQAEPIFVLPTPIEIKEGWDGDLEVGL